MFFLFYFYSRANARSLLLPSGHSERLFQFQVLKRVFLYGQLLRCTSCAGQFFLGTGLIFLTLLHFIKNV